MDDWTHYVPLACGYAVALLAWFLAFRARPAWWPAPDPRPFKRPLREVLFVLLAGVGIIAIGQLYSAGFHLPQEGNFGPIFEAVNQAAIFCPLVILLLIRKQGPDTAWIRTDWIPLRLLFGVAVASLAVIVFTVVEPGGRAWWQVLPRVWNYDNVGLAAQVFLEDLAIAMLVVRFRAAVGTKWAVSVVAFLFAAGHIPAMLSGGQPAYEFLYLLLDFTLGLAIISCALRAADLWWLWPVHFAMDMMQFERITGA